MPSAELIALAKTVAMRHGLAPELVAALCDHETGGTWDPFTCRYEEAFYEHYVRPMKMPFDAIRSMATEAVTRSTSYGLGQIMGETARELGFTGRYLTELCDPETGLEYACKKLTQCLQLANGDIAAGLSKYNGGGDGSYSSAVISLIPKYR